MLTSPSWWDCNIYGDVVAPEQDTKQVITEALVNQSAKTVTVLSSLLAIEDALGYIPLQAIELVAEHTKSTINEVWGVASFYTNFRFSKPGENTIEICWGPTCHLLGSQEILQSVLDSLELSEEGDTKDGKVSLKYNTCLGACSQGPVISVNHKIIGPRSMGGPNGASLREKILDMVSSLREK